MENILSVIALILSSYFIVRIFKPTGITETVLTFFSFFTAHIISLGYLLSLINYLNNVRYWCIAGLIIVFISAVVTFNIDRQFISLRNLKLASLKKRIAFIKDTPPFEKLILIPLISTTLFLGILNLAVIIFTAPHNWDSMTYHLARVAYYLQYNNLSYFEANYWAQVVHPKNSSLLLLYTYLVSLKNENLTQLVQFISYLVAIYSIYAISRKIGLNKIHCIIAAMIGALLTEWLMQSTTTQNDMLLTAYVGATTYFLFAFKETSKIKYIIIASLCIGLSIGTKASAILSLPSLVLIALYTLIPFGAKLHLRNLAIFFACTLLAVIVFALPSGYIDNCHNFGNPGGPEQIRKVHSFEGESTRHVVINGSKNLVRFGFDFLSLDGLPPIDITRSFQGLLRAIPEKIVSGLEIDLQTPIASRTSFNLRKLPAAHEDNSFWGIFGFSLIWITVFLSAIGVVKSNNMRVLSVAAVLFLLSQAYAGPYDPWRGRYFTICAVFAVPTVGVCLQTRNKFVRIYLFIIVLLGCLSAVSAIVLRDNSSIISTYDRPSIFKMDRVEQLTRNRTEYLEPLKRFDRLVPGNATVAVFLKENSFEYPLFGNYLTRTIIPVNSFNNGFQTIPPKTEYLLYTVNGFPSASSNDIFLGNDWYLRKLHTKR